VKGKFGHRVRKFFENDDKSRLAQAIYLWGPIGVSAAALVGAITHDLLHGDAQFTGSAGAIVTICGAWSGYGGTTRMWIERAPGFKSGVRDVPYGKVGFLLIALGTVVWAFGDTWMADVTRDP
jgi:hypothetical protein